MKQGKENYPELPLKANLLTTAVRRSLSIGGAAITLSLSPMVAAQGSFGAIVELSELNGSNGFVINGIESTDSAGKSVSAAGDINGDGIDDLILGAYGQEANGNFNAGSSYVIFGGVAVGMNSTFELSDLDGSNGFAINGITANERSGYSVNDAGDVNGDGIDDLIIGAPTANSNNSSRTGKAYVLFGGETVGTSGSFELSDLNGNNGFAINGIGQGNYAGHSVSGAGDINGDGVQDMIIGAPRADTVGIGVTGASYVLFGGESTGSNGSVDLSDLDGNNGFVVSGTNNQDQLGSSVSKAGDFNGDGFDDLIIGAKDADPGYGGITGASYLLFGGESVGQGNALDLRNLDPSDGFEISGIHTYDSLGNSVSDAGDVNGDGFDDLILATENGVEDELYVVFGGADVASSGFFDLSSLDGRNGFVINAVNVGDFDRPAVSGAGDINGDGLADLIVGARRANTQRAGIGESYVLFGSENVVMGGNFELSNLDGNNGFAINGPVNGSYTGSSVSDAGDINSDGIDDLIISDWFGSDDAGERYVIFGQADSALATCNGLAVTVDLSFGQSPGPGDDVILGTEGNDIIIGSAGNDTICGLGGDDIIRGNAGNDWIDGGDGKDDIRGGIGNDQISGGNGADFIRGDRGQDTINGGAGADILSGGKGADLINGDGGKDTLYGGFGDDQINGGNDNDTIRGDVGRDSLNGDGGNDDILGGPGSDLLNGGDGNDNLRGWSGDDRLNGNAGNDILSGGGGSDICEGGSGTDTTGSSCENMVSLRVDALTATHH